MPKHWAPWSEVRLWFAIAGAAAAILLIGVTVTSYLLPADPEAGRHTFLLGAYGSWQPGGLVIAAIVFTNNLLVLALHYFCCQVGVIVSRPHKPLSGRMARFDAFHQPLPKWMADGALVYALGITVISIALQTTRLGFILSDIAAYSGLEPWRLILLVLPHAIPELCAVFLPMGLFILQTWRRDLPKLRLYINQTLVIALPILICAALVEGFIAPNLIEWQIQSSLGTAG